MAGPWKKICCGVDFSPQARVTVEEAAHLSRTRGAALTLVHVFGAPKPPMFATDSLATPPADEEARLRTALEPQLEEYRAEAERIAERPVEAVLLAGKPAEVLARLAADGGYDLIVVGTHGRSGVKRLVLGSVAEHVVRASPISVLVVRG
jgi:nucleotide-binding universal stress UspA family protein